MNIVKIINERRSKGGIMHIQEDNNYHWQHWMYWTGFFCITSILDE